MKVETLMVLWHGKEPVFSVDFHPSGKLASSGADNDVKLWQVGKKDDGVFVEYLCSLSRHSKSVNCVRFSPNGNFLASGSDDGFIFIWKHNPSATIPPDSTDKEIWTTFTPLRSKAQDVYDMAWSPDGGWMLAGSTDNSASIYHIKSNSCRHHFEHHSHYVQGVAWDPLGEYIASFSSDRTLRIYTRKKRKISAKKAKEASDGKKSGESGDVSAPKKVIDKWDLFQVVNKREYSKIGEKDSKNTNDIFSAKGKEKEKELLQHKMFMDENINTFFRRLTWSPEGSLLFVPTGVFKATPSDTPSNTTYIFSRHTLNKPLLHIPSGKPSIGVRCNPVLFKLWEDAPPSVNNIDSNTSSQQSSGINTSVFNLPYRIIFAIASTDCVAIYDTQRPHPLAYYSDLHYTNLTDITWSADGQILLMSSTDGYCSAASFAEGELGTPLPENEFPEAMKEAALLRQYVDEDIPSIPAVAPTSDPPTNGDDNSSHSKLKDDGVAAIASTRDTNKDIPKQPEKKQRRIAPTLVAPPSDK